MKTYHCDCGHSIFFENTFCIQCNHALGFIPQRLILKSIYPEKQLGWSTKTDKNIYKKCKNYSEENACNWMVPISDPEDYCLSCRLNEMVPNLSISDQKKHWLLIESAKRRLIYTLIRLNLPLVSKRESPAQGLAFRFLEDDRNVKVLTGHENGIITINAVEADDVEREKRRISLKEPYRTLLGHFRHEIGHYYWDRLVFNTTYLEPFREKFGDEQLDYTSALNQYYQSEIKQGWQNEYISVYASAHPWEDWAESWAHYLHIQDTLEVALHFGLLHEKLSISSSHSKASWLASKPVSFAEKISAWSELTIALNSLNRSMGLQDLYPFVLSPKVVEKLRFISDVIAGRPIS